MYNIQEANIAMTLGKFLWEIVCKSLLTIWTPVISVATLMSLFIADWTDVTKVLLLIIVLLCFLVYRICRTVYPIYKEIDRTSRDENNSLSVRTIMSDGSKIILEKCDTVSVGNLYSIFYNRGEAEFFACVIEIEAINSSGFIQGNVIYDAVSIAEFRDDPERLQVKRILFRRDLGCLIQQ